jgi:hypothetical protein
MFKFVINLLHEETFLQQLSKYMSDDEIVPNIQLEFISFTPEHQCNLKLTFNSNHTARVVNKVVERNLRHYLRCGGIATYPLNGGDIHLQFVGFAMGPERDQELIDIIERRRKCTRSFDCENRD